MRYRWRLDVSQIPDVSTLVPWEAVLFQQCVLSFVVRFFLSVLPQDDHSVIWGQQFEGGVKESIYVKLERPSLYRGGGLTHYWSPAYNVALSFLPRHLNNHSHLDPLSCNDPHEGRSGQQPKRVLKDSHTGFKTLQLPSSWDVRRLRERRCSSWMNDYLHQPTIKPPLETEGTKHGIALVRSSVNGLLVTTP